MADLNGILILNKPYGMTSRRAVDRVQRLIRPLKAGHAGTLDPLAAGVLVVCVGAATRLIEYVQRMPKSYAATFLLGRQSPTEDLEGEVTVLENPPVPSLDQVAAAARSLTGSIAQRPPAFSALKIEGRRAYALARRGKAVPLAPRTIEVHSLDVESYDYPELRLRITCGSGTYVRSLGRDLAERLGTAAVMSALVRTAIGGFRLEEAVDPGTLTAENWTAHLLPSLRAVEMLPRVDLDDHDVERVRCGREILGTSGPCDAEEYAAVDATGHLAAILTPRPDGRLGPRRVLLPGTEGERKDLSQSPERVARP